MRIVEFFRQRLLLAAGLAGLLLGAVVGLAGPLPVTTAEATAEAPWVPYGKMELARFSEAEFNTLRGARIWGGTASTGPQAVQWTLTGIIAAPEPAALVSVPGGKNIQQVKAAGELPDGGRIVDITNRSVRFTRSGCTYERSLYSAVDPAEKSGECPQEPAQQIRK